MKFTSQDKIVVVGCCGLTHYNYYYLLLTSSSIPTLDWRTPNTAGGGAKRGIYMNRVHFMIPSHAIKTKVVMRPMTG